MGLEKAEGGKTTKWMMAFKVHGRRLYIFADGPSPAILKTIRYTSKRGGKSMLFLLKDLIAY